MRESVFFTLVVCLLILSCGKDRSNQFLKDKVSAEQSLNNKDYYQAVSTLEKYSIDKLSKNNSLKILVDSYLGLCEVDAISLMKQSEKIKPLLNFEFTNEEVVFEKLKKIEENIIYPNIHCQSYIEKSAFISETYSLGLKNKKDVFLYRGNLYLVLGIYQVKKMIKRIINLTGLEANEIDIEESIKYFLEDIINLRSKISSVNENYKQSYEQLSPLIEVMDKILILPEFFEKLREAQGNKKETN